MKKLNIIFTSLLMVALLLVSMLTAFAETVPTELPPVPTEQVTSPVYEPTEAPTGFEENVTNPTDVAPTGPTEEPFTEVTEPLTDFSRPTEYDEDNEPNTYSDYVSPAPIYTPSDQDFSKKDWEEIKIEIKDTPNEGNVGSFDNIKGNTAKGDEKSPLLLILCIVFWCLALSCLTFVILYKPKTEKAVPVKAQPRAQRRTEPKVSDDYNDGY